jgi:stage II sporulation protein D
LIVGRRVASRLAFLAAVVLAVAGCAVGPRVVPPPTPTPAVTPAPTPQPTPTPPAAFAVPERDDVRPPLVRVLLQAAADPVLPDPGRRYAVVTGLSASLLRGPLSAKLVPGRAAVQVGAFAQDGGAQGALVRLTALGFEARSETQGDGLQRVLAVAREGETQDALARRLAQAGFADQKRLGAGVGGSVVVEGEGGVSVRADRVRVVPLELEPVRVGGKSVRGELEVRAGLEGVAVINVLSLEEYLRGVLPGEMGPRTFPLLDALKAQAVAARTYAVAHLGDHAQEGYDLCDSPSCQVYEGAGAEQALSDRAVHETAGEVIVFQGRPIDAMYHSTCAGHTEDAAALFPQRAQPYLKGVVCRGERVLVAGDGAKTGHWLGPQDRLVSVGDALAGAVGAPREPRGLAARLSATHPGAGVTGLVKAFGLEGAAATLDVPAVQGTDETILELLRTFRLPLPPPPQSGSRSGWEIALVVRLGQLAGKVQAVQGRLVPGPQGVRLVSDGGENPRDLSGREAVLERRGERWRRNTLSFPSGSSATLWCAGETCPLLEVEPLEEADAGSSWTWWVRELPLEEVARRLGVPGAREVRVTRRGVSGRALAVSVTGSNGVKEFPGMAFRRALDLPDTLFVTMRSGAPTQPAVRFLGRGWGHGVGLCQNGAYGLARGGASYQEILKTYYTGVEVARLEGGRP